MRVSGLTVGPDEGTVSVIAVSGLIRCRSRDGSSCSSLASARTEDSPIPVQNSLRRCVIHCATATISSSSSNSGGSWAPAQADNRNGPEWFRPDSPTSAALRCRDARPDINVEPLGQFGARPLAARL